MPGPTDAAEVVAFRAADVLLSLMSTIAVFAMSSADMTDAEMFSSGPMTMFAEVLCPTIWPIYI